MERLTLTGDIGRPPQRPCLGTAHLSGGTPGPDDITHSGSKGQLTLVSGGAGARAHAETLRARLACAERDSRAKDDFLAMVAHELRNPLDAISLSVRALEMTDAGNTARARSHALILRQVAQMAHLIDDLLDIERVASGKIRLDRQPLEMAQAVRHVVAAFTADARMDRHIDISTQPLWVEADAVRLEQVLANLVTNAVKYTPPGGRIRVELRADGDDAVLVVEDTGFGIPAALLPFVFDLYVQGEDALRRARGGLGIGLTLVRRLVELHGGSITASSAGEGRGSQFTVRLPRIPSARQRPPLSVPTGSGATPKRVLLIDDCDDGREGLRLLLQHAGHVVFDAADGVRGLELLSMRPDVAIIDINLPGMDGYRVATQVREAPQGRRMRLVALTGHSSADVATRAAAHGFDHHLVKPVDMDQLARLLVDMPEAAQRISP